MNTCIRTIASVGLLGTSLVCSCGNEGEGRTPHEFEQPAIVCHIPQVPSPLPSSGVVGDGFGFNCTEAALRSTIAEGGNITFNCGGQATIPIENEIIVPVDSIIDGAGEITLDGGNVTRIFHTEAGVTLTVKGITFVNGNAGYDPLGSGGAIRGGWLSKLNIFDCVFQDNTAAADGIEGGGAVYQSNGGALTVVRSTFHRNFAVSGGAIDNLLSPMTVVNSTFTENKAMAGGGAVYDDGASAYTDDGKGGTISICGCHFEDNQSQNTGGAVYLWAYEPDLLLINQSSFIRNRTFRPTDGSALGGAVRTGNVPLQIANSLFHENHADVHGGAYWTRGNYNTEIVNSTFYRNTAGVDGEDGGYGGALSGFNVQLKNNTFVENHAVFSGGAISAKGEEWRVDNCVFLDNTSSNPWEMSQTCNRTISGTHGVQWPAPAGSEDPFCVQNATIENPLLGDLSNNGGGTQTIPLLTGSPCINGGNNCPEFDQRGEPRNVPCDIGAFEVQ